MAENTHNKNPSSTIISIISIFMSPTEKSSLFSIGWIGGGIVRHVNHPSYLSAAIGAVPHEKCISCGDVMITIARKKKVLQGSRDVKFGVYRAQKHVENVLARLFRPFYSKQLQLVKQIGLQYQQATPDVDYIDFQRLNDCALWLGIASVWTRMKTSTPKKFIDAAQASIRIRKLVPFFRGWGINGL